MLACTALVGCTDDDVLGGGENQKAVKMDTYISLSVNSNIDSSRSTEKDYGDEDGSVESSKHLAVAQRTESDVNSMLVIVTPSSDEVSVNPTVNNAPTINGFVKYLTAGDFTQSTDKKTVNMTTPERVDYIQTYKAMVVLNPVAGLLTELGYNETDKTFTKNHRDAYAAVCNYSGAGYENIGTAEAPNYSFMMANQSEETVTPTEANQVETNPAKAVIEVERAVSKVTFRPVVGDDDESGDDDNKYDIAVTIKEYKAEFKRKWYKEEYKETIDGKETEVVKYTYAIFNKATYNNGTVWVLLNEAKQYEGGQVDPDDIVGIFQEQEENGKTVEYTGYVEIEANPDLNEEEYTGNKTAPLLKDITPTGTDYLNSLTFVVTDVTPEEPSTDNYTIKLEKYALTNMSNKVYAVRHSGTSGAKVPCGELANTDYIVDPYTANKVAGENAAYSTWFEPATLYSTIVGQAKADNISGWNALPTSVGYNSEDDAVSSAHGSVADAGHLLRYCYENSVLRANVNDNLISGVVFVGQIMDGDAAVPVLYKYNGNFYRTLKALLMKNTGLNISENSSEKAITDAGIEIYKDGKCYYYAGIKHFDNSVPDYDYVNNVKTYDVTNGVGNMEFAIMRNNIYSLAITGISGIGMSTLELQAGTGIEDQSAFITVECSILPWIVRFNDIKF